MRLACKMPYQICSVYLFCVSYYTNFNWRTLIKTFSLCKLIMPICLIKISLNNSMSFDNAPRCYLPTFHIVAKICSPIHVIYGFLTLQLLN